MSTIEACDYPGCTNSAKEKCGVCGNIYCVRHIRLTGLIYTCDLCIARVLAEKEAEEARKRAEQVAATVRRAAELAQRQVELEADRPRREAERKRREAKRQKRIALAWIGGLMIVFSIVIADVQDPTTPAPLLLRVVLGLIFFGGIIVVLLAIFGFRD